MIQANELHIGNLVYFNGNVEWSITAEDIVFADSNSESFNEQYKPISLTEEWLLRFGFKEKRGFYSLLITDVVQNNVPLTIMCYPKKNRLWVHIGDHSLPYFNYHVHQLQNLFHLLTGKELITE